MIKMPNFSELSKKMNLQGVLDNVKSAMSSTVSSDKPPEGDELFNKFTEIMGLMETLTDMHTQQAKAIANIKSKMNELNKDIQTVKMAATSTVIEAQKTPVETVVDTSTKTGTAKTTKTTKSKKSEG